MTSIFLTVLNVSITASYLILVVLLLRLLLKKAPKWISCILWCIVALRLVMPFSIESKLSLVPSSEPIIPTQQGNYYYKIDTGIDKFDNAVNQIIIPNIVLNNNSGISNNETIDINNGDNNNNKENINYNNGATNNNNSNNNNSNDNSSSITNKQEIKTNVTQSNNKELSLFDTFFIVWITGIAVMLTLSAISYIRIKKRVRPSIVHQDNIYYCDSIDSPFILGIIKPKIYIPSSINNDDLKFILDHEYAHLKRRDHLWKPFGFLLLSIYWFNPFIWLSYMLLCHDIESACDEKVIKSMNTEEKKRYSTTLLNCSIHRKIISACPIAFGEIGVKKRVKSVLNYKRPAFWIIAVAIITSIAVAVCFLTNPKTRHKENPVNLSFLPLEFSVSGNGAWYTALTLNPDGSFSGKYTDWSADSGENYAGRYTICEFSGKFEDIKEKDEYSYSLTLKKFESKYKDGEEWIEDGTKYVAVDSLEGMTVGSTFFLYKHNTPIAQLDKSVWIDCPYHYEETQESTLCCYTLYNPESKKSYFSQRIFDTNKAQVFYSYVELMNDFYNQVPDFYYTTKDVDGNGIEELIIINNTQITVYTYEDSVKQLDSYDFVTGTFRMFSSEKEQYPGIFYYTIGGGCDHYSYLTLYDGNIATTKLCEYYYSADEPYWVDISDEKEMIAEAKELYNQNKDIEFVKFEPVDVVKNTVSFVNGSTEYTATVIFSEVNLASTNLVISNTKTGKEIQNIPLNPSEQVTSCDRNVYSLDLNFDGYYDLLVPDMNPARAIFFSAYIYDSENQQFVEAPSFKELPNISLDADNKQIIYSSGGDSMQSYGKAWYDKNAKDFVTSHSILIEPINDQYHFKECRYEDGVETVVNEFDIPPHEYYLYPVSNENLLPYHEYGTLWELGSDKWDCVFKKNESGKIYLPDNSTIQPANLSLDEAKSIIEPLLEKGETVHESINNDLADIEIEDKVSFTIENNGDKYDYHLVTDEAFKSIDDVWQFAYTAYTQEAAYRLFVDNLNQANDSRFLVRDEKLYYHGGGHGYSSNFQFDSLQIITQFDNTVILSVDCHFGFGFQESEPPEKAIFIIQNTKNGWRLANSVNEGVDKINIDNYKAYLPNRTQQTIAAVNAYYDFLNGKIYARNTGFKSLASANDTKYISISDLATANLTSGIDKYSFYDINQDGTPELLTKGYCYDIFSFKDNEVLWLYSSPEISSGHAFLTRDNSFIWYKITTGTTYEHVTINKDLNVTAVNFFDGEGSSQNPEDEIYYFNDNKVTKWEFENSTKNLLLNAKHNDEAVVLWTDVAGNNLDRNIGETQPETQETITIDGKGYQSYVASSADIRYVFVSNKEFEMSPNWGWVPVGTKDFYSLLLLGNVNEDRAILKKGVSKKVLNNEQSFYSTNKKTDVILSDYNKKALKYSYVDMDNDNIDELAIEFEDGNILILRIDGESVIGFEVGMRAMYQINTDGSFLWNKNSGNTYGCSRLEFTGKTYNTIELWRIENNESGSTAYYIDGKAATKEEVDSLIVPPSINWNSFSTAP